MRIGQYQFPGRVVLAPMAGVTDQPFRNLGREYGASLAVSEMVAVKPALRGSKKSAWRSEHRGENGICSVQIVGTEPEQMASGARYNVRRGADIIDINMGCPAKKVCKKAAGSALMRDEKQVTDILAAVVASVDVPVTLKIRTGWSDDEKNAVRIAELAERAGVQALAVHGRTRADAFRGDAEYETIRDVVAAVGIPVFANGDIDTPEKAQQVLEYTGAAAVMLGRSAQGNPWLIQRMQHYLATGDLLALPDEAEILTVMHKHLQAMLAFYGEYAGVRIARKHMGWYGVHLTRGAQLKSRINQAQTAAEQIRILQHELDETVNQTGMAA